MNKHIDHFPNFEKHPSITQSSSENLKPKGHSPGSDNIACVFRIPQTVPRPFPQQSGSYGRGQAVAHSHPEYPPSLRRDTGQWALDIPGPHLKYLQGKVLLALIMMDFFLLITTQYELKALCDMLPS